MGEQEKITFEVRDRLGRTVRLRESVYERHLPTHREMADYLEEAKQTIIDPDYELEDGENCYGYYRMGLGKGRYEKCFIAVPVYYRRTLWGDEGEVATFHLTRRLGRGKITWKRPRD